MLLREGNFGLAGYKPAGVLGRVEHHFRRVMGGARGLAHSEEMLARAITCAFLEEGGGKENSGKWEAEIPTVDTASTQALLDSLEVQRARIEGLEASLADRGSDVERHEQRLLRLETGYMLRIDALERENAILQERLAKLEQAPPVLTALDTVPDPRVEKLEQSVAGLHGRVSALIGKVNRLAGKAEAEQRGD